MYCFRDNCVLSLVDCRLYGIYYISFVFCFVWALVERVGIFFINLQSLFLRDVIVSSCNFKLLKHNNFWRRGFFNIGDSLLKLDLSLPGGTIAVYWTLCFMISIACFWNLYTEKKGVQFLHTCVCHFRKACVELSK